MKKLIFLSGIVFLVLFTAVAYSVSSTKDNVSINSNPQTLCPYKIHVYGDGGCLTGTYQYCINGGSPVTVNASGGAFLVDFPSGTSSTICIKAIGSTCGGSLVVSVPSPCNSIVTDVYVELVKDSPNCDCSNS